MTLIYRRRMLLQKKIPITYMTTLFTDGTFIINEKSSSRAANIALHGAVTNEYPPLDENNTYVFSALAARPWNNEATSIRNVEFGSSVKPTSTAMWFANCSNMTSFNQTNLDTSSVTSFGSMFFNTGITSIDLSNFNTSSVTSFRGMFYNCKSLASIDLSNFNTSNATTFNGMFQNCKSLASIDMSNFNTSNVTDMTNMFYNCAFTSIDISHFDTSNVTLMSSMFGNCKNMTSIDLSNFDTSNVTSMMGMFMICSSLTSVDLSSFDTSNVKEIQQLFRDCSNLTSATIGISNNSYGSITNSNKIFENCSNLSAVTINGLNVLPLTSSSALNNLKVECQIKVPSALVNSYKSATNWSTRASYISAI